MIEKLKNSELVPIFRRLLIGYLIFLAIGTIICLISILFENTETIRLSDGFQIQSYQTILDVKENNKIDVTEIMKVNWQEENHTTIQEYIPEWNEYTGKDGKTIKKKSKISSYKAVGEPYIVDTDKKKTRITIGNEKKPNELGEKTYTIKYTYDMGKDPYPEWDELIFHAFGDYWKTEIKNASLQINMPKNIDDVTIHFFLDKYREKEITNQMDYERDENTIYAEFNQEKYEQLQKAEYCSKKGQENCSMPKKMIENLDQSLTIDIELPEGYFTNTNWNYGFGSFFLCIAIYCLTFLNFYRWSRYGKDYPKKSQTREFYAPENYSSAEIGYIYGNANSKKLTVSLIIQLACKGYIKIDELNDNRKNIQITNQVKKPKNEILISPFIPKRIIEVEKLKEVDSKLTKLERIIMNRLFQNSNRKEITSQLETFLKVKDSLLKKGYITIIKDNDKSRLLEYEEKKNEYEQKLKEYTMEKENYNQKMNELSPLTELEEMIYHELFLEKDVILLREEKYFSSIFKEIDFLLKAKLKKVIDDELATLKMIQSIFMPILVFLLHLVAYDFINDLDPIWNNLYFLSVVCIFINIFLTMIMKRKTKYGESIVARVKGFQNYLFNMNQEKLIELIHQNPNYFYEIIPYAYVFNNFKKWVGKLDSIPIPIYDMGNYSYTNYDSFQKIYHNIYYLEPFRNLSYQMASDTEDEIN